jgi:hypothetical protein
VAHLAGWTEFNRFIIFINPNRVTGWPVVNVTGAYCFFLTVREAYMDRSLHYGSPMGTLAKIIWQSLQ